MKYPCFYVLWNNQNKTGETVEIISFGEFLTNSTIRLNGYEVVKVYSIKEEADDKLNSLKMMNKLIE